MEAYTEFSKWYDGLMEDVPYDDWFRFVKKILSENDINDGIVCELGAGTGNFTMRLAKAGYDMIGIDNSEDMLAEAQKKKVEELDREDNENVSNIMYICQDMREFELYGTVKAVVSVCDSINYLLEDEDVVTTFKLVNNYLDPSGLFVFDFNTLHKYRDVIGDSVISNSSESEDDEVTFIWSNCFDEETHINEYDVCFFVPKCEDEEQGILYRRFQEYHYQRGDTLDEIKSFIEKAGLIFVDAYDEVGYGTPGETSERIFVVAKESGK